MEALINSSKQAINILILINTIFMVHVQMLTLRFVVLEGAVQWVVPLNESLELFGPKAPLHSVS